MSNQNTNNHEHTSHMKLMTIVFVSLLALTAITVMASGLDLGAAWVNIAVAMVIASIKAGLVAVFFMHLKWEDKLTWAIASLSLPLLILLVGFNVWDIAIRVLAKLYT